MTASQGEIDLLLGYMPLICRSRCSDFDRKFAISMTGRMKRGPVRPTEKQIKVMRRMADDFRAAMRDDAPLVEQGD